MGNFDMRAINPFIRLATYSILSPGATLSTRVIYDYVLVYIESGRLAYTCDGICYDCGPGMFLLFRPGVRHSFEIGEEELSQPHIHFDMVFSSRSETTPVCFKDLDALTPAERQMIQKDVFDGCPNDPRITFSDKEKALKLFYDIIDAPKGTVSLVQKARLIELIHMIATENFQQVVGNQQRTQYDVCAQLKEYMDAGQGLFSSLSELEKQYSYSKFYLERQFKKNYGVSLIAYRNERRMQQAEVLLRIHSVSQTAEILGFSSIGSFSRAFKKHFGENPSQYKK